MVIDNTKVVIRDRKLMIIMAISFTVIIPILCFTEFFDYPVLGINREIYIIFICSLYLFINVYRFILDLNYIYFNDNNVKLIIKFYSLRPFMKKHRSIEIQKETLYKYEIKRSIASRKKSLILFQRVNNRVAKYPPISISALNEEEFINLLTSLNAVVIGNK